MIYKRRVQFYETDAQGVVHHSNYFRYFEEARGEYLRELGTPYSEIRSLGYEVVLLSASCEFKKPLKYDEVVCIELSITEVNRFTFEFAYRVEVQGEERARGMTRHCLVRDGKIVSIPKEIRDKLCSGIC
jgi:acyl-CoA thioester hydrolase